MVATENIIVGAAHGNSGASELKPRKAWILTSAKKAKSIFSLVGAIFLTFPIFAQDEYLPLVDTNQAVTVQLGVYSGSTLNTSDIITTLSDVPFRFFVQPIGVKFTVSDGMWGLSIPNLYQAGSIGLRPRVLSYSQCPVKDNVSGLAYPYKYFPSLQTLYRFVESCYLSGIASSAFVEQSRTSEAVYCNVDIPTMFANCLSSTNGVWRSTVVNLLSSFRSELEAFRSDFSDVGAVNYDILETLHNMENSFSQVHYFDIMPFTNSLSFAQSKGYISQSEYEMRLRDYNSLSSDPSAQAQYARDFQFYLDSARRLSDDITSALNNPDTSEYGKKLNEGLNDSINSGFSASAHIQGATTNLLQKMTNMTEQIKKDLEAWRTDSTNRLEQQWEGIKDVKDNTGDTAAGVSTIVNQGVKIKGPVEVTIGTDNINVDIANTDLDSLVDGFANGSDAAMQRWLDEWEMFKADQIPYMGQFSAFFDSNTNLLSSIDRRVDFGFTNTLDSIYDSLTNGLDVSSTNELWDYYFDRFKKANEFMDDDGQLFTSIDNQRQLVFGNGFDEAEYKKLDWFSRVELLLYQIGYASTNGTESIEAPDLEGEFDDVSDEIQSAASAFEGAARRVVGVFSLVGRFADAVKNAFADVAAPSTDGILLLEGGSWIFQEPLYLRVPVLIQNALRLVFQCVWYLSAFVIGWRLVSFAWGRVASLVRWLWSLIDV